MGDGDCSEIPGNASWRLRGFVSDEPEHQSFKMATQAVASWNQVVQWLREMNLLREAAEPCAA